MNIEFLNYSKVVIRAYGIPLTMVFYLIVLFILYTFIIEPLINMMGIRHWILSYIYPLIAVIAIFISKNMDDKYFQNKNIENLILKYMGRKKNFKSNL